MKRFVYNQKYAKLLVEMSGKTSQIDELARSINANAGHLRIVLDQWHKEGVISKDKKGRDYKIKLTDKGEAIGLALAKLIKLDNNWEEVEIEEDDIDMTKEESKDWSKLEKEENKKGNENGTTTTTRT